MLSASSKIELPAHSAGSDATAFPGIARLVPSLPRELALSSPKGLQIGVPCAVAFEPAPRCRRPSRRPTAAANRARLEISENSRFVLFSQPPCLPASLSPSRRSTFAKAEPASHSAQKKCHTVQSLFTRIFNKTNDPCTKKCHKISPPAARRRNCHPRECVLLSRHFTCRGGN
jgi:hypothetical protein